MKNILMKKLLLASLMVAAGLSNVAHAAFVLDSGLPNNTGFPLALDGNDYYAAEFSLTAGQTIDSIQAFITAGLSTPGDSFTISLYANNPSRNLPSTTPLFSRQATYQQDGWNGLSGLGLSGLAAGKYWAAFEVGAADSTLGLDLPLQASGGTSPALAYAFSAGGAYQLMQQGFGVQVSTVPLPGALLFFCSGLAGFAGLSRFTRRARAQLA